MEEDKTNINSFLSMLQATLLTILISIGYFLFITLKNFTLNLNSFLSASLIIMLFYYSVAGFIFSGIFQYLNKNYSTLFYLVLSFFCLWALIFILSHSVEKKYNNQIPDIMDGVSESITIFLIKIIFIAIISNFAVILKNWYFTKKENSLTDSEL